MARKTALITGCSTGFGKLAVRTFHQKGWNVAATMRAPERETELTQLDGVLVTRLDVTDNESIQAAVDATLERFGTIDVLVNNAGVGGHGLLEQMPEANVRAMYETNVFGVMNTCRAVMPHMRRQKDGCIINVTSGAGFMGLPAETAYCSAKFAIEGFTEALAHECKLLGIRVKSVLPGAYLTTSFSENANDQFLESGDEELVAHVKRLREHFMNAVRSEGGETADPQEVVDVIYRCATTDAPVHNPVGKDMEMIMGLAGGPSRQEFIEKVEPLLLPSRA